MHNLSSVLQAQIRSDFVIADSASHVVIDVDQNNELHVGWWVEGSIYHQKFDSIGNPLSDPIIVCAAHIPTNKSCSPFFTMKSTGNRTFFIWSEAAGFNSYIKAKYISGSDQSNTVQLNDIYYDALRGTPDVSVLSDTTLMIVWSGQGKQTQTNIAIYGQLTTTTLDLIGPDLVLSDYDGGDGNPNLPSISNHVDNPYSLVAWLDDRTGKLSVYGRLIKVDGTPEGESFLISENPESAYVWSPDVLMNVNDSFWVVYSAEISDNEWNVYYRLIDQHGSPVDSSVQINSGRARGAAEVRIAADHEGRIVVIWEGNYDQYQNSVIMGQLFFPDGTKIGNNFRISTYPDGEDHIFPSVDNHEGMIYTAWQGEWDGLTSTVWANIIDFENPTSNIEREETGLSHDFSSSYNFPNPFNSYTNIQFSISRTSYIKITVYDLLGSQIAVLTNQRFLPGIHQIIWNGLDRSGFIAPSGVYLLQFVVNEQPHSGKISLIR